MPDTKASGKRAHSTLKAGLTLGIFGGGQLARMMTLAAANLGVKVHIFAPEPDSPAFEVCANFTCAAYSDRAALEAFASQIDAATYEFENVPTTTLDRMAKFAPMLPINPRASALAITQDRVLEKTFMADLGLATAPFAPVSSLNDLEKALVRIGTPAILKTRRFGYDGKGQARVDDPGLAKSAWEAIGGQPAILEGFINFRREISVITARAFDGKVLAYDVCENEHRNHILSRTTVPAHLTTATAQAAHDAAVLIAEKLDYIGIMTVEMFVVGEGDGEQVVMNEIAPRVHNSGHWTIEGAQTSQFEQHVRAVLALPLGAVDSCGTIMMDNLLGEDMHRVPALLETPGAHLHLYGKKQARKGRKMGHVTFVARSETKLT